MKKKCLIDSTAAENIRFHPKIGPKEMTTLIWYRNRDTERRLEIIGIIREMNRNNRVGDNKRDFRIVPPKT